MKLSVIIPAYNRAEIIPNTIDSILDSGLDDLEIIVVDDGSTDRTPDVVQAMGSPVRYFRQANAGPAAARNSGFAASRGQYVAFLDSDDQWFPGAVLTLIRQLDELGDVPFIFGDALMGSPDRGFVSVLQTFGGDPFRSLPSREIEPGLRRFEREPVFRQLVRRNFIFLGSMVLRREVVDEVGGFDPSLFGSEDWEFCLRLALRYEFCFRDGLALAVYNQHSSGSLTNDQDRMYAGFCKALERLLGEPGLGGAERAHVLHHLKRTRFDYAYPAYDRGDFGAAGDRFFDCLRSGFGWKPFFYWLVCQCPSTVLERARLLKQKHS
jgi:glycosyltransferase involved in cell wall biosynthesis